MNVTIPQPMTTLQVVAVQNLTGRQHSHVRVFGYRVEDPMRLLLEVALFPDDAVDLISAADVEKKFPEIEIETRYIMKILTTAGIDVIHIGEVGDDPTSGPPLHPRRGA